MDSFLKTFLKPTFKHLHQKPRSYLSVTFIADSPSTLTFMYFCALSVAVDAVVAVIA